MTDEQRKELVRCSIEASKNAYAPYSRFNVGAALLCHDGEVFTGCNVENSSFGLTICAERVAATSAIAANQREFVAIAIATKGGASPCGACRQFLNEFAADLKVIMVDVESESETKEMTLSELLPETFHFDR